MKKMTISRCLPTDWFYWLAVALAVILWAMFCGRLYLLDNKYTDPGPQAERGLLALDASDLKQHPVTHLIGGWEYYEDALLTPADFKTDPLPLPDDHVFIGQYPGFDRPQAGGRTSSPHGSASYRLVLSLPEEVTSYTLELPEIYSSSSVYLNGLLVRQYGETAPESYSAQTRLSHIEFIGSGQLEILIAASDFSHVYSGMVYPPAFGLSEQVSATLLTRAVIRAFACSAAAVTGLFYFITGALSKNRQGILLGLLCLCFIGFTCYPLTRALFLLPFTLSYTLEHVSFLGLFFFSILLHDQICPLSRCWAVFFAFGGLALCLPGTAYRALLSAGILSGDAVVMNAHSAVISLFKYTTAGYLSLTTVVAARRGELLSRILLPGFLILAVSLIADRLLPLYEPILFGWFTEWGAFHLITCYTAAVSADMARTSRDRAALRERLEGASHFIALQRSYFPALAGKIEEAKSARHDFRHHVTVIQSFAAEGQENALLRYLESLSPSLKQKDPILWCQNHTIDVLLQHYSAKAREKRISFDADVQVPEEIFLPDTDLAALLGNLLENGIEACSHLRSDGKSPFIRLEILHKKSALLFSMENSWDGYGARSDHAEQRFLSRKRNGLSEGIGLVSIRSLAETYSGQAEFDGDVSEGVFYSTITLHDQRTQQNCPTTSH